MQIMETFVRRAIHLLWILSVVLADSDTCPDQVAKRKWGGRVARTVDYQLLPIKYVIVHHTVTAACTKKAKCAEILSNIQTYHMDQLGFDDIAYNFLIGGDGRVYEGAGWHTVGAHTYGYNRNGLGLAFIGDFTEELPTRAAMDAAKQLIGCGVTLGELDEHYVLLGGRQVIASESPGLELYAEIQDWNNWAAQP